MLLDPNWEPPEEAKARGRGLGRTTKMLLRAIHLAVDPQTVVILWRNEEEARWGFDWTLDILGSEVGAGFKIVRKNGPPIIGFGFSEIHFVPLRALPGQYLSRGIHSLSILEDHSVEDGLPYRQSRMWHHFNQWREAINHVQRLTESRQTKDSLWLALTTSRV